MKTLSAILLTTLCAAGPAIAAPADDMVGTWECRQPGVEYKNKPPILFIEGAAAKNPKEAIVLEVDGFTREVYGLSDVTEDSDGWWKVKPEKGTEFMVRPESASKNGAASMALKRSGTSFHCLRLPPQRAS